VARPGTTSTATQRVIHAAFRLDPLRPAQGRPVSAGPEPDQATIRAELEPVLKAELAELDRLSAASADDRAAVALDQQSVGRLARMDAMQLQAMALAADRRRQQRRSRIAAALARLSEGDFGYCAACGDFIGLGRLRVDPTTPRCIGCAGGGA
jgi:DnaK suppressor protein